MRYGLLPLSLTLFLAAVPAAVADDPKPDVKAKEIGKNVFFETEGEQRRVVVKAYVCFREGQLEGLLCRKFTKEHEYILAADADARHIHTALLAARAKPGSPVQFDPKFVPASGSVIKVTLRYKKDGKDVVLPAQDWIRDVAAKKTLQESWVFGGSRFLPDPDDKTKPDIYLANQGDVICLCNMETAMMDLPIRSPRKLEERTYQAISDKIPELNTPVDVILEVAEKKEKCVGEGVSG
jgi:hypothetical protein